MADKGGGGVPLKKKRGLLDSILWVAICAAVGAGLALSQLDKVARPVGVHSPGFIAKTDAEAIEAQWPHYQTMFGRLGRERGWPPTTKERYLEEIRHGSLYVGSPETVARKIAATVKALNIQRFDLKYATGPTPHGQLVEAISLYGSKVIPMVHDILSGS